MAVRVIRIDGERFTDETGRTRLLRGVNLGGSSKLPAHGDSFVGRPFPLDEADEHLARLKSWGLTTLRLLTTWEAIEHDGEGRYDLAYLDHFEAIVRRAHEQGFDVFIDFHQDVWSRFTGGDGAPRWTLEAAGFDVANLHATGAAFLEGEHQGPLPRMIWPTNAGKLGSATMFTLLFGGDTFAPRAKLQALLRERFFGAVSTLLSRVKHHVFAVDLLNEPSPGYIGWRDLTKPGAPVEVGAMPSPLQSFQLGMGATLEIPVYERGWLGPRIVRRERVNPAGKKAWRERCVWADEGVWEGDRLLRPDHFTRGDFADDFYRPFLDEGAKHLHGLPLMIETEPFKEGPKWKGGASAVWAPHWYDGFALFFVDYRAWVAADAFTQKPVFTPWLIRKSFAAQLGRLASDARTRGLPCLIGELGVPGVLPAAAMDRTLTAVEDAQVSATIWNYSADHSAARGDGWNGEDFSIWSRDARRPIEAVARPYPRAVAGKLLRYGFELSSRTFTLELDGDGGETEVFVPALHYPHGVTADQPVEQRGDRVIWRAQGRQRLSLRPAAAPASPR